MQDNFDIMASEADAFSDAINPPNKPSDILLIAGLKKDYDVIVSEAIDYIIQKDRSEEFLEEIYSATKN